MRQIEFDRVSGIRQIRLASGLPGQAQIFRAAGEIIREYSLQRPMRVLALPPRPHILALTKIDPPDVNLVRGQTQSRRRD
jgi:hypothetical protein